MHITKEVLELVPQETIDEVIHSYRMNHTAETYIQIAGMAYDNEDDYKVLFSHETLYNNHGKLDIHISGVVKGNYNKIVTSFSFLEVNKLLHTDFTLEKLRECMHVRKV